MAGITGIGGVFLFARDTDRLADWYVRHLGFSLEPMSEDGGPATYFQEIFCRDLENPQLKLQTVFAIMPSKEDLGLQRDQVMINYRVDDLDALVLQLNEAGIETGPVSVEFDGQGQGKFSRMSDPEGNRIELWEHIGP
jgi:catechol 2,3-dioxygenase-like lactoylglutathione lyase family enzyme